MNRSEDGCVGRAMRSLLLPVSLAVLVSACGGDDDDAEAEASTGGEAQRSEAQRLWDEQPEPPTHVAHRYAYTPPQTCSQGPFTATFVTEGSPHFEGFVAYACVRHDIRGDVRVVVEGRGPNEPYSYGYERPENGRCVASDAERAQATAAAASVESAPEATPPRSTGRTARGGRGGRSAPREEPAPAEPAGPPALPVSDATFEGCPDGLRRVGVTSMDFLSAHGVAIQAGLRVGVELWFAEPNDLEGALFVLEHTVSDEGTTPETYQAYRDAYDAWSARYRAALDAEVAAGAERTDFDPGATAPPPPARTETPPPRPSQNATWVPGYWMRGEGEAATAPGAVNGWVFLPGFWRVPPSDIAQELTVRAPEPPPPPRIEPEETKGPSPAANAVWTPGYWQWNGAAYVWIAGAYRVPPSAGQRWTPSTWRVGVGGRGAVFVPGGWTGGASR